MSAQFRPGPHHCRYQRRRRNRLRLERLETRRLLATLAVTSTVDAVDANPGDGICEISSGGACTLRAAIQEANALSDSDGPDQISLPAGTYTFSLDGTDEGLASTGDLDITDDLILQGAGAADTIIDGAGIDRVIDVVRGSVEINGVTIRGGLIQDDEGTVESSGGGIRNEGVLTLVDSTVTGNTSPVGAGIANYNGMLRISRSTISANGDAETRRGGGVANFANYDPASLETSDTTITNNRADRGGGISNYSYDGVATATISRSTISGNAADVGGGIANRSVAYYYDTVASNLTIRGSTISGNVADSSGGGIHNEANNGSIAVVDVANSTITANAATAGDGGGILSTPESTATIQSVIVAGNDAGGEGPDLSSDSLTASFSLIQNTLGHSIVDGVNNNIVGADPLLGPLVDNGGHTLTHSLSEGSPAIDRGSNPDVLVNDQRGSGFARTVDDPEVSDASDGTDVGAVEVGQVPLVADLSLTLSVDEASPELDQDVKFTITLTNDGPDRATNVEVTDFLPFDLFFTSSTVSQGAYDDLDGIWFVGDLDSDATAFLNITAVVDSTNPISYSAELTASDQLDPDSTPDNDVGGEDDQATIEIGTCLTSESIQTGVSRLTYSCATPGSISAFVRGTQRGSQSFPLYAATVDIADAEEIAVAVADSDGVAVVFLHWTEADLDQTILVQAFEMVPNVKKSNTLSLEPVAQMLRAGAIGPGAPALQPESLPAIVDAAVSRWQVVGVSAADVALLRGVQINVGDLPGNAIGRVVSGSIVLDHNAAGNGWFVDGTPFDDSEFDAIESAGAGRIDLLTTLVHEFGHVLGLPDLSDPENVMHDTLEVGVRRYPTSNTNRSDPLDVNDDTIVSALDALAIINSLNRSRIGEVPSVWVGNDDGQVTYLDTNADFTVSALDALQIINHLSRVRATVPSGEVVRSTDTIRPLSLGSTGSETSIPGASALLNEATVFARHLTPIPRSEESLLPLESSDPVLSGPEKEFESVLQDIAADVLMHQARRLTGY